MRSNILLESAWLKPIASGCLWVLLVVPILAVSGTYAVTKMNGGEPIISRSMFVQVGQPKRGENINGPSMVKVPDWLPREHRAHPSAEYYLYFANHGGKEINMAWASDISGPYHLYNVNADQTRGIGGVLEMGGDKKIELDNSLSVVGHIASPEVQVDTENQRFVMYFHGPAAFGGERLKFQRTFVATSKNGLNFNTDGSDASSRFGVRPVLLGVSYFRVFEVDNELYAVSNGGGLYRARSYSRPWTPPENFDFREDLWERRKDGLEIPGQTESSKSVGYRHFAISRGDETTIELFYSRRGDAPECIIRSVLDVTGPWDGWSLNGDSETVLCPEEVWEGATEPVLPSKSGPARERLNQLRDPYVYEEAGNTYLFYAGGGESAIGMALLQENVN